MPKILAIDDINDNLISLKAIIDDTFPEAVVFTALNGQKGIELALANNPDVILLDIIMPGMDGFEVCRRLKLDEQTRDIPVVFVTALKGDKENRIKALEVGAEGFLSKPIDETELTAQIRAMLKIKAANDQKRNEKERLEKLVAERTKELVINQTELKSIFDNLQDAYFQADLLGKFTKVSPSVLKMYGYKTFNELIGQPAEKLYFNIQDRNSMLSVLRSVGRVEDYVCKGRKQDGTPIWVSMNIQFIYGDNGHILGTEGVARDISERKQAEELLRDSEERFRHISSSISDISYSCVLDPDGKSTISWLYGATESITGFTPKEIMDMECWGKLVVQEDFPVFADKIIGLKPGQSENCTLRIRKKDGAIIWIQASSQCVKGQSGTNKIYGGLVDITERKQAEKQMLESHQFQESLLKTIPFGMDIVDEEGNILFQSENMEKIFGKSAIGRKCWSLYRDDHSQCVDCPLHKGVEIGETALYETKGVLGGRTFEISHTGMMFKGKKAMLEIFMDITERKASDLELKQSEERYRSFISQVSEGVYRFESDRPMDLDLPVEAQIDYIYDHMFIAECNDALVKMYGSANKDEIVGKTHLDFHDGRNNPTNRETLRRFILNGYTIHNEITEEKNSQGKKFYFSNNSTGIIENNRLVRVWGTQIDITEKMKADVLQDVLHGISNAALITDNLDELIEIIRQQLGRLIDSTNFFIAFYNEKTGLLSTVYEKDEVDAITSWPASKSITGYVIRNQKSMLITEDEMKSLVEQGEIEHIGTSSKIWLGVPLMVSKKPIGAIVVQSYTRADAYTERDKQILELVSNQICIAIERKRADEDLKKALAKAQESDYLKSAFLANMSHEIRTPLNSIIGFSDLLTDPDFDREQHAEFAELISRSGNGLLAIINDIMDLSKIEAGQIYLEKHFFKASKLIERVQKEYSFIAAKKEVELIFVSELATDELVLNSDENRLRQVLVNFVSNAIKFTSKGIIEIGLQKTGNSVRFYVTDSGIGIPSEYHQIVFDRFRQVESADTRKYGGNGLGLAISKSLIELLGGEIGVESEIGKGSTFYFILPLSKIE